MNTYSSLKAMPIVVLLLVLTGCTDKPQLTPRQQLERDIAELEASISASESVLRDAAIGIAQKQANIQFEVAKAVNESKSLGMDVQKARTETVQRLREDIQVEIEVSKAQRECLQEDKRKLEDARAKLQTLVK